MKSWKLPHLARGKKEKLVGTWLNEISLFVQLDINLCGGSYNHIAVSELITVSYILF